MSDPEDQKLVTLARSARARARTAQGAAVRDTDGRTYVAAAVDLPNLQISALRLAVAMAASSGVGSLEAAAVVGSEPAPADVAAVRDLAGSGRSILLADDHGEILSAGTTHDGAPPAVRQLRLVVEAEDFDEAVAFYRDVLGLTEQVAFGGDGEARIAILEAGRATLELANPAQRKMIDEVEVGHSTPHRLKVAFEVDDVRRSTDRLTASGADLVADARETPWRSLNSRLDGPAGLHITLFEELESLEERSAREGFGTSGERKDDR
jgi:predicted enzyme related to lactoylglutathione lyase